MTRPHPAPGTAEPSASDQGLYERLIADLDAAGACYRLIEHPTEDRTELVSAMRGPPGRARRQVSRPGAPQSLR